MTDKKSNDSRRKLLKSVAVGGGAAVAGKALPESWSKPVVDAVILPAHAATTTDKDPVESTTTQGCCLIEETYCVALVLDQAFLDIKVETDGTITVSVQSDGTQILTDKIPCTGGTFTASDDNHTVTGLVGCAATSIGGSAKIFGGDSIDYIAEKNLCKGSGT